MTSERLPGVWTPPPRTLSGDDADEGILGAEVHPFYNNPAGEWLNSGYGQPGTRAGPDTKRGARGVWSSSSRSARGRPRDPESYGASRRAWRGPAFLSPRPAFASRGRFQARKLQLPESSSVAAPAVGLWELKSARLERAAAGTRAETSEASPAGGTAVQTLPFS